MNTEDEDFANQFKAVTERLRYIYKDYPSPRVWAAVLIHSLKNLISQSSNPSATLEQIVESLKETEDR